ncbi:unnamed protein product, partial [marine sediment metagenome]
PHVENREVKFKIVGKGYEPMPKDFHPEDGTISRAVSACPVCGSIVDAKTTRKLFQEGKTRQKMIAVVLKRPHTTGKRYRIATERDIQFITEAREYLKVKRNKLIQEWGIDPIPDEPIPLTMPGGIHTPTYGMTTWGSLFNHRQINSLITFVENIRRTYRLMLESGYDPNYAKVITSYLSIALDKVAIYQTSLGYWHNTRELVNPGMGRQALQMAWDYAESNVFNGNADWNSAISWIMKVVTHCSSIPVTIPEGARVTQSSATSLDYPDNFFDAIFT